MFICCVCLYVVYVYTLCMFICCVCLYVVYVYMLYLYVYMLQLRRSKKSSSDANSFSNNTWNTCACLVIKSMRQCIDIQNVIQKCSLHTKTFWSKYVAFKLLTFSFVLNITVTPFVNILLHSTEGGYMCSSKIYSILFYKGDP